MDDKKSFLITTCILHFLEGLLFYFIYSIYGGSWDLYVVGLFVSLLVSYPVWNEARELKESLKQKG